MAYDLYAGTVSEKGVRPYRCRSNERYWVAADHPTLDTRHIVHGKPARIVRSNDMTSRTYSYDPAIVYGCDTAFPTAVTTYHNSDGVFADSAGITTWNGQYVTFANLASVVDITSYLATATHIELRCGTQIQDTGIAAAPAFAFLLDGASDVPTHFVSPPTHLTSAGLWCYQGASAGFKVNPNSGGTHRCPRVIDGDPCIPGVNHYTATNAARLYAQAYSFAPAVEVILEDIAQDGVEQSVQVISYFSLHGGWPTINLRYYSDYVGDEKTINVYAVCFPSNITTLVWTATIAAGDPIDGTVTGATLSLGGVPSNTTGVALYMDHPYREAGQNRVAIAIPAEMPSANPSQTTDWPAVVPGYVLRVSL